MAKKKRKKPNLPREALERAEAQAAGRPADRPAEPRRPAPQPAVRPGQPTLPAARPAQMVDLAREYWYVAEDLRRIGILAAAILIVLVVVRIVAG